MNSDNKLYKYDDVIELVMTESSMYLDNKPMNSRRIQFHKGLSNEIYFHVRNRDRKLQNVFADTVRAYLIDPSTQRRVLVRHLEHTDQIGKLRLVLTEEDLQGLEPGLYTAYLTRSQSDVEELPLYADQNNGVRFDVEISNQVLMNPAPTQVSNTFLQTANVALGDDRTSFVSNALMGNVERNFSNAQHTMAIYPEAYSGNITIQASCIVGTPDSDDLSWDWYDVTTVQLGNANVSVNEVESVTFSTNCNWVRLVSHPDTGSITKIMLRN